ncbi:MAG: Fic family protein [Acidobacteriaceae bacterium]|jgi:Fic family protein|nr:Fic family protein [Acidobacteriaceae bacterium]
MRWNWEQPEWPEFSYDGTGIDALERDFLSRSGEFMGIFRHVGKDDQNALRIELISQEAIKTSEIEGEILNRDSVQSSLRHQFGLSLESADTPPAERGIAAMMADLYERFATPLTGHTLCTWHSLLMSGDESIRTVGGYRAHDEPMQVVSGPIGRRKVHFEAPPSKAVPAEMRRFIAWFNETAPRGSAPLPALVRAGLAHLYFVSIHPFEDGNGRIGRALAEKSLAQTLGRPSLIALAHTIESQRKDYYAALEDNNKGMEVTKWLEYFAHTVIEAQTTTIRIADFYIGKAKFYQRLHGQLNERQAKVMARLFKEGIEGFKGGLSAQNYAAITGAPRATVTRDLQDLVAKGALDRTGELRYTRYFLKLL